MRSLKSFSLIILSSSLLIIVFSIILMKNWNFAAIRSKAGEENFTVKYDIPYGPHPMQKLDLCLPNPLRQGNKYPAAILIHGGGGDKSGFIHICKRLATNGIVAAEVNFREEPPPAYKVVLADNKLALQWLKDREFVDSERVGAMGGSLGGFVSSLMGTTEFDNKVKCVVNNFGMTDLTDPNLDWSTEFMKNIVDKFFAGITYADDPRLYRNLSPITHVSSNDASPWLFTRSINDHLVPRSQMTRMIEKLKSVNIPAEFYEFNGKGPGHALELPPLEALKLLEKRVNFLKECL